MFKVAEKEKQETPGKEDPVRGKWGKEAQWVWWLYSWTYTKDQKIKY